MRDLGAAIHFGQNPFEPQFLFQSQITLDFSRAGIADQNLKLNARDLLRLEPLNGGSYQKPADSLTPISVIHEDLADETNREAAEIRRQTADSACQEADRTALSFGHKQAGEAAQHGGHRRSPVFEAGRRNRE